MMAFHEEEDLTSPYVDLSEDQRREYHLRRALGIANSYIRFGYNGQNITWDSVTWATDFLASMLDDGDLLDDLALVVRFKLDEVFMRHVSDSQSKIVHYPTFRAPIFTQKAAHV